MTQAKLKKSETEKPEKNENANTMQETEWKTKCFSDKCIQIAAWALLTLGLCIIVSTFYLAINQHANHDYDGNYIPDRGSNYENSNKNLTDMNVNIISKEYELQVLGLGNISLDGCQEKICKMLCVKTENIYSTMFMKMQDSNCSSLDSLVIYKQNFERGILNNSWQYSSAKTVQEVALIRSNIVVIRSAAFNSPMFSTTFLLYWYNLNLERVESGALLGLYSLKYLIINSGIKCLDRAFFQPVQTSLVYLTINAGLTINKDESIFGISQLRKLEYADLSRNSFNGPITKKTFEYAIKLKYLILQGCKITVISDDTFSHLAGTLLLLDLSNNMLTTLSDKVFEPLFNTNMGLIINIVMNSLICDCNIRPLAKLYKEYRGRFMDALYCKAPHKLYGKFIDEVEPMLEPCDIDATTSITTIQDSVEDTEPIFKTTSGPTEIETEEDNDVSSKDSSSEETTSEEAHYFKMRCWTMYDSDRSSGSIENSNSHMEEILSNEVNSIETSTKSIWSSLKNELSAYNIKLQGSMSNTVDYFDFDKPDYDFELYLFENKSVKVTINDLEDDSINIVWFDEENENYENFATASCSQYGIPYFITDPLEENKTYTFCLIKDGRSTITPFNCLPLHVPIFIDIEENIWISHDQKQFTIGMLCLIFLMSTFTGAAVAYFGIKTYPDLLEGSKNVLVVKKSDQTCYVSTISEADYVQKKSSLKKKPSSLSLQKSSIPSTPSTVISAKDLERLSSVKSSTTYFEDAFIPINYEDDEYEMPKPTEKPQLIYESRCIPNTYVATSPRRSPPPLPKRNSKSFPSDVMLYGTKE